MIPHTVSKWLKFVQSFFRGTSALIVVILFAAIAGYCFYRSRKSRSSDDYDYRTKPSTGWFAGLLGFLGRNKRTKNKLRLGDQDDTNELFVPFLFACARSLTRILGTSLSSKRPLYLQPRTTPTRTIRRRVPPALPRNSRQTRLKHPRDSP